MKRGFRGRCPRCGEGKLFRAFLKVDNHCSVCGLDFTPHRADDLPAYLVIVIVGHLVVPVACGSKPIIRRRCGCSSRSICRSRWCVAAAAAAGQGRRGRDAMGAADARI
jgi:hypothetical protein